MSVEKKTIIVDGVNLNIVFGKTKGEWITKYQHNDVDNELWDFSLEEMLNGSVEPNADIWYWLIDNRLYETFDKGEEDDDEANNTNLIEEQPYSVYMDGECVKSFNVLAEAIDHAAYLYGKGYSDDVTIWNNQISKEIEW